MRRSDFVVRFLRVSALFGEEGIGRIADGGGFHQVQAAQGLALLANVFEDLRAGWVGNAREVDFEEFGESLAISGAVQHAVYLVEHLDL